MINGYNYGWICPRCNRVYGPLVQECAQCNFDKAPYIGPTITYGITDNGLEVVCNGQNGKRQ